MAGMAKKWKLLAVRRSRSLKFLAQYSALCALLLLLLTLNSVHEHNKGNDVSGRPLHHKSPQPTANLFPPPSRLGNIPDFAFVINRDICGQDPVDLLVLVGSYPGNYDMRKVIRQTLGAPRPDHRVIKLAFLYGRPDHPIPQQIIVDESDRYGDVVQGRFRDDYYNVTLRDLMGLRWAWRQCAQARYVMHLDDDTSVNVDHVLDALEENMPKDEDYVACFHVLNDSQVLREGRYGLTREEHPGDVFDRYCAGWCYWLTPGAAKRLDEVALNHTPYKINDAYLTGTLMTALGWKHLKIELPMTIYEEQIQRWLDGSDHADPYFSIAPNECNLTLALLINAKFRQHSLENRWPRRHHIRVAE